MIPNPDSISASPSPPSSHPPPETDNDTTATPMEDQVIDALLTRYLALLDEYTALRAALHTRQAALFQQLARANYAAAAAGAGGGGGRRYGADYYDGRMQACRRVRVSVRSGGGGDGEGHDGEVDGGEGGVRHGDGSTVMESAEGRATVLVEEVVEPVVDDAGVAGDDGAMIKFAVVEVDAESQDDGTGTQHEDTNAEEADAAQKPASEDKEEEDDATETQGEKEPQVRKKPHDPLRWFGILTPPALREAQRHAVAAVEDIIPKLATLSTEMARIELEVRRARKRRAKAEKAEQKRLLELVDKMGQVDVSA